MTYFYQTPKDLKEFFNAAGAQIKLIPAGLKEGFLNDFVNEFLNQVSLNDFDEIPVSFWCLQVVANKPSPNKTIHEIDEKSCTALFLVFKISESRNLFIFNSRYPLSCCVGELIPGLRCLGI